MDIVLASASPRRRELLEMLGVKELRVIPAVGEEVITDGMLPSAAVCSLSLAKAEEVSKLCKKDDVVIGADTIVVVDGDVFGKPADDTDARHMLGLLSGREHQVITGVAVVAGKQVWSDWQETAVKFRVLTAGEIERYVMSGEAADKAGAYAIQGLGALLVDSISGCYSNVVGLPLVTLNRLLGQAGVRLL